MPVSSHFNNYGSKPEQRLYEDLLVESIKIMGFEAYYLINENNQARDLLYGEDPVKRFESAFPIELYLSDSMDYLGQKEFFSKFGLEIKNNVKVIISRRTFQQRVPQVDFNRPREGDLIYVPFLNGTGELYEITFADQDKDFHTLARKQPYFYELSLEKFKYSQEIINTGVGEIDLVVTNNAYSLNLNIGAGVGAFVNKEIVYQSADTTEANATCVAVVQSWMPMNNTLTVTNIAGEFINNQLIYGSQGKAQYMLATFDPLLDNSFSETYDNKHIAESADAITDFSEINPFGTI